MKTILNKETTIKGVDDKPIDYIWLYRFAVQQQPQGGFTLEEMAKRMRLINVFDSSKETDRFELEDSDADTLLKLFAAAKFAFVHNDILACKSDLDSSIKTK